MIDGKYFTFDLKILVIFILSYIFRLVIRFLICTLTWGEVYLMKFYMIKFGGNLQKMVDYRILQKFGDFCIQSWFSLGTLVSSTNKTDHHNITEILLKVALNSINLNSSSPNEFYRGIKHDDKIRILFQAKMRDFSI